MASFNPKVGDIGVEIVVNFPTCDCDGKIIPLDVSTATTIEICLRKPDQLTIVTFTAVFSTCGVGDGTDGSISYTTVSATDLDVAGTWAVSGKVIFPDSRVFRGDAKTMIVEISVCP